MPRYVDHETRRRHIAATAAQIAGTRGLEALTYRNVADAAGSSTTVLTHYFAGRRTEAMGSYAAILPLINYENRQCGLRACKTVMMEGRVIKSDAVRHPLEPLHPATRAGLLELAAAANPLALRWGL